MGDKKSGSGDARPAWTDITLAAGALIAIVVGIVLLKLHLSGHGAMPPALLTFVHNPAEQKSDANFADAINSHGWCVIVGYTLVLTACIAVYRRIVFSEAGKKLIPMLCGTLVTAVLANVIENFLVLRAIGGHPIELDVFGGHHVITSEHLRLALSAVAIIKWSAFLVALSAIPLVAVSGIRLGKSHISKWWVAKKLNLEEPWWSSVLYQPEPPRDQHDDQEAWRDAYFVPELEPKNRTTALCLSGGGIRSACIAMGAMQTFSESRSRGAKLDEFDYIVSVSGGGYSAGARLLAVQPENPHIAQPTLELSDGYAPGSPEFDYLRRTSSYIGDTPVQLLRALAEVVKNLLASLFILFSLAFLVGWAAGWFYGQIPLTAIEPQHTDPDSLQLSLAPTGAAIAVLAVTAVVFGAAALFCEWCSVSEKFTVAQQRLNAAAMAVALFGLITLLLTVALPGLLYLSSPTVSSPDQIADHRPSVAAFGGVAAVTFIQLIGTLVAMLRGKGAPASDTASKPWWKRLLPPPIIQMGITLGTLAILLYAWLIVVGRTGAWVYSNVEDKGAIVKHWVWFWLAIGALMVFLSCCDVTSLSLHPFYRSRLARTFSVRRLRGEAVPYDRREPTWIDQYGHTPQGKPEFVFAAAAAVSGIEKPGPGQNAVSYVLGSKFVGGPALGWLHTAELREVAGARIKRDLTVQAAVAISGAAFASTMGRQSVGLQTLFAASGARLGTWLPNPRYVRNAQHNATNRIFPKALPSVRGAGYFYRELFGIHKSDSRLLQVTDGGHYENLGLVEALRRRCRLIYCIDGSGDLPPLLSGFEEAVRLAESELGVTIIPDPIPAPPPHDEPAVAGEVRPDGLRFAPEELAPGSAIRFPQANPFQSLNDRLTAGAVMRAKICYPEASGVGKDDTGVLIFAKATLWKELPGWVLTHAASKGNENFPHDGTGNQWFNEAQFAAYIEVGRRIAAETWRVPMPDGFVVPPVSSSRVASPR